MRLPYIRSIGVDRSRASVRILNELIINRGRFGGRILLCGLRDPAHLSSRRTRGVQRKVPPRSVPAGQATATSWSFLFGCVRGGLSNTTSASRRHQNIAHRTLRRFAFELAAADFSARLDGGASTDQSEGRSVKFKASPRARHRRLWDLLSCGRASLLSAASL